MKTFYTPSTGNKPCAQLTHRREPISYMKTGITLMLMMVVFALPAQITTSTINGLVTGQGDEPLIGATVLATHVPSGTTYGAVTNLIGRFVLPAVRVGGPFTIEVSYLGYESQTQDNIFTGLGATSSLRFELNETAIMADEVLIVGSRYSRFGDGKTGSSLNLTSERIQRLPTINRSINDFTRLTPQSNGYSFAGTNAKFNNYSIDGNIYNNNFGVTSTQFAGGNPISKDAIEAVSVSLAPYDVRYSGFTGASVNAVTKSGTNDFRGSVYYIFRNDQMQGNKAGSLSVDPGTSENTIWGATLGGPIIKNKLFFFASYEKETEAVPSFLKRAAREGETPDGLII